MNEQKLENVNEVASYYATADRRLMHFEYRVYDTPHQLYILHSSKLSETILAFLHTGTVSHWYVRILCKLLLLALRNQLSFASPVSDKKANPNAEITGSALMACPS
jgi:hypothetical protein